MMDWKRRRGSRPEGEPEAGAPHDREAGAASPDREAGEPTGAAGGVDPDPVFASADAAEDAEGAAVESDGVDAEFRSDEVDVAEEETTALVLERELAEVRDRHLRLAAEFENFRKRTHREQAELRPRAQAELAARLLPALDDLARVAATPRESTSVEALEQGMDLIRRNLLKELEAAGLERIEAEGVRFDPEVHEGIMVVATDDPDQDEVVSRVLVDGYRFRGRLLRPARVEVMRYGADSGPGAAATASTEGANGGEGGRR